MRNLLDVREDAELGRRRPPLGRWVVAAGLAGLWLLGCVPTNTPEPTPTKPAPTATALPPTSISTPNPTSTPTPVPSPTHWAVDVEPPLGEAGYALPLTIAHLTETSATLFFELDAPRPGMVVLRPLDGAAPVREITLSPDRIRHMLRFDGLEPGVNYEALVALGQGPADFTQPAFQGRAWGPVQLRTPAEDGRLRFGLLSDASFGDPATQALVEMMAGHELDFTLHAGDVVDETEQGVDPYLSYAEKFYTPFEPLLTRMPVYTIPGNHDYDADIRYQGEPFFYHAFPPFENVDGDSPADGKRQYYAFAQEGLQFALLDSQVLFGIPGREAQRAWLEARLADPTFRATIPVFHVAPYSSSTVHPTDSLPARAAWVPRFEAAGVPLVLSGHFHHYERALQNGITYIVAGGGSSTLYGLGERIPESQAAARRTHFVLVELDGERLILTAIDLQGEAFDRAEILLP
jgi:predicted phosphodiesterase